MFCYSVGGVAASTVMVVESEFPPSTLTVTVATPAAVARNVEEMPEVALSVPPVSPGETDQVTLLASPFASVTVKSRLVPSLMV